jgi:LysR family glycine cleavage system transcriptional activator
MSDWLPSLNALRAFETVSRHLNYRRAADELHVSPAAVKQLVRKLEDALGKPLLEKRGRGLVLTATGDAASRDLIRAFRQIISTVEKIRKTEQGARLIISVDPSFAAAWLVPRLQDFRVRNPAIEVLIDSSMEVVDLQRGAADIAIRFGVPPDGNLVTRRLFDEEICVFCSPSLAEGPPGISRLEDLANVTLLRWDLSQFEWARVTREWIDWGHWLAHVGADGIHPSDELQFNDYNLMVQAAIAGQGVILGSKPVLKNLVEANLLVDPIPESAIPKIGYDLVASESALAREEVASFLDWIIEKANS